MDKILFVLGLCELEVYLVVPSAQVMFDKPDKILKLVVWETDEATQQRAIRTIREFEWAELKKAQAWVKWYLDITLPKALLKQLQF